MSTISFADIVHSPISFNSEIESHRLVLELIDSAWFQRLRDVSQTANTRLVYMFSEHTRFGHSIGVAYQAELLMEKLSKSFPNQIAEYRTAVAAAALLHDVGHLAPGSHTAFKTWYPDLPDTHEEIAVRLVKEAPELVSILEKYDPQLPATVARILKEDPDLPAWTWEIISGGGWNVDRGNWCIVDSIMAGVRYGEYNIGALVESVTISDDNHLCLEENRLDAMMHFVLSRHAMYRQIYLHRVLLAADTISMSLVRRARELDSLCFVDKEMREVLDSKGPESLSIATIFRMREAWWKYHVMQWTEDKDPVVSDLSKRIIRRNLFKTVRIRSADDQQQLLAQAEESVEKAGFDPKYYLHTVSTYDPHTGDSKHAMPVKMDTGDLRDLADSDPLFKVIISDAAQYMKRWIVVPEEAKNLMGRDR